ncbi:MAG TPA: MFS transporter [Rhodospirillales bacterium]|nr:MFS transporter [Rhodospirillales bacterium]
MAEIPFQGGETAGGTSHASFRALFAWCLFDWANSAFPTVIITFVFAAYFTQGVAADVVTGTAQWGYAMAVSALAVALSAPFCGAMADHSGRRKPWLLVLTVLCATTTFLLWFTRPDPADALWALICVGVANFAFEMGQVFYNSMLPDLSPKAKVGRISGWGWGLGYAGGLACLGLVLVGFVETDEPWFGLAKDQAQNLRAVAPLTAIWFAVFAVPLFALTPDTAATGIGAGEAFRRGLAALWETLKHIKDYAQIARFLLARMIYTDGLNTLFAFGGIYAAGTFGMDFSELIIFGIGMNVTAGLGAALFAWIDDWIGPKRTILIAVTALTLFGGALLFVQSKTFFWVFGLPLGIFIGPAQAASRSMMARLAPPRLRAEMFGLYALSGKATAFLGPVALAWVTTYAGSQRAGMATILIFFIIGMALLWPISDCRR